MMFPVKKRWFLSTKEKKCFAQIFVCSPFLHTFQKNPEIKGDLGRIEGTFSSGMS